MEQTTKLDHYINNKTDCKNEKANQNNALRRVADGTWAAKEKTVTMRGIKPWFAKWIGQTAHRVFPCLRPPVPQGKLKV